MPIKLIIGLGNPTKEYQKTYHNVGLLAVDFLIQNQEKKWQAVPSKEFEYLKSDGVIFVKPLVFMNESGRAVKSALKYFKNEPAEIIVIHDDSDIYLGDHKLSCDSGAAGHHGIESIIKHLKNQNFCRIRIGIRPRTRISADQDADKRGNNIRVNQRENLRKSASIMKAGDFVLKKYLPLTRKYLKRFFKKSPKKLKSYIKSQTESHSAGTDSNSRERKRNIFNIFLFF